MCGIVGIVDPSSLPETLRPIVQRMCDVIRHRGPDDEGIYVESGIGLGSCRLSILDLSPLGHMPMVDEETGNRIVHNGEVYNFLELRKELVGLGAMGNGEGAVVTYSPTGKRVVAL